MQCCSRTPSLSYQKGLMLSLEQPEIPLKRPKGHNG